MWDNALGSVTIELLDELVTEKSLAGLDGGLFYQFKVRAKNIYGYGEYSDIQTIEASDVPDVMAILDTSIVGTQVKFTWVAPFDNYEPVDQYDLQIMKLDNTFYSDAVNCPGTPVTQEFCHVEMDTLRTQSNLRQGDLIRAKIRARNLNGWGAYSQVNFAGAVVETRPLKMQSPSFDISSSNNNEIKLTWIPLTLGAETGGIPVDEYRVSYKLDADTTWTTVTSATSGFTVISSLTAGSTYNFKVFAVNKYGVGPDSDTVSIVAGQRPDPAVTAPTLSLTGVYVQIVWDAAIPNHVPVDAYKILIKGKDGTFSE